MKEIKEIINTHREITALELARLLRKKSQKVPLAQAAHR